ncbi:MAG: MFS transporter [Pyrinomonadaceae bacterium]
MFTNLTYGELISHNRDFRNLLWGQVVSELGNWFNFVALLGVVRLVSGGSVEAAGILMFWRTLPFALLMGIAGPVVDRVSRKKILIITDLLRAAFALLLLFVNDSGDLWLVYFAAILSSSASAFFDGAKNAATPNITGKEGLLAGTALLFSSRFLLMAIGSALGGIAAVFFGYKTAFVINSISYLVSAFSIWLIPAGRMNEKITEEDKLRAPTKFIDDLREGISYAMNNRFALTILLINIIWAMGGGMTFVLFEAYSKANFAGGFSADFANSTLLTASGLGLTIGMLAAHRVSAVVERTHTIREFIGITLVLHGIAFAIAAVTKNLWVAAAFVLISRLLVGSEFSLQETMFQRSLPDKIRGRISTLDRGAEVTMFSISGYAAGILLSNYSTVVVGILAGLLAGSTGLVWLLRTKNDAINSV